MFLQFKQTTINLILLKGYSCGGGGGGFFKKKKRKNLKKPVFLTV
ncbi:hypothetical protein [uncultured Helicobacter sp.]|nr:hypothetical protein [uncultured Helicobacter sp.]